MSDGEMLNLEGVNYGEIIGPRVMRLRSNISGLTLDGLSDRIREIGVKLSGKSIWQIEQGLRVDISLRQITALAYGLECSISDLWDIPTKKDLKRRSS
jgi:DNA-binding Xre family transcriptional regulator